MSIQQVPGPLRFLAFNPPFTDVRENDFRQLIEYVAWGRVGSLEDGAALLKTKEEESGALGPRGQSGARRGTAGGRAGAARSQAGVSPADAEARARATS